jgi:hypothetical protein
VALDQLLRLFGREIRFLKSSFLTCFFGFPTRISFDPEGAYYTFTKGITTLPDGITTLRELKTI